MHSMKFSNGNWLNREGLNVRPGMAVRDALLETDLVTLYVPCKHIRHRGDTLDGPLLTVRLSSPMPGVIRLLTTHFEGAVARGPVFAHSLPNEIHTSDVSVTDDDAAIWIRTGDMSAKVSKGQDFRIEFYHGDTLLTAVPMGGMAYITTDGAGGEQRSPIAKGVGNPDDSVFLASLQAAETGPYMRGQLQLGVGECVYGLGERFTPFVKNGQTVEIWNEDGGTGTEQAYKNIPFYLTNRGYGVFVNHPERVSFEIASERVSRAQFSVHGESLDYFIIDGPTPKEVLGKYTQLTGRAALPPAWSFGLWLTTSFTTDYDEQTVTHFVDGMAERNLPLHVFHFDCFWMGEFQWTDFEWDRRVFPDPEGMLRRLKDKGLHICVWLNPYIGQKSRLFAEGMKNGYLLKKPNGDVWQWDRWQAGMALVDFTNPDACEWYAANLRRLIDMGVDAFKTDFGERIPTDVVYYDGSDAVKMHNYYSFLYNELVFNVLKEKRGVGEAVVFARSATAGGQQFPVHWGGDSSADYESMAESLRGGLSLGLSGFGFWSHDIGGFESKSSPDIYKRWIAFGLLSSHSRLHGSSTYRVPWLYDDEAVDVLRYFTNLKCRLMPYLFGVSKQATESGLPVMRAMVLEFPNDPACEYLDRQYMLGDSLLVAPVFRADGEVTYYLPEGEWTHFLTNARVQGGTWRREKYDYLGLPLFVKSNSIIPVGRESTTTSYDFADGVTFHAFGLDEDTSIETSVLNERGDEEATFTLVRRGGVIRARAVGATKPWSLVVHGWDGSVKATGGSAEVVAPDELHVKPLSPGEEIVIFE